MTTSNSKSQKTVFHDKKSLKLTNNVQTDWTQLNTETFSLPSHREMDQEKELIKQPRIVLSKTVIFLKMRTIQIREIGLIIEGQCLKRKNIHGRQKISIMRVIVATREASTKLPVKFFQVDSLLFHLKTHLKSFPIYHKLSRNPFQILMLSP